MKVVNLNTTVFWDVCSDDHGNSRLYRILTNLNVKASLSSVVMLHRH